MKEPCQSLARSAFTLIELLVVIGILGILIAITLPSFTGLGRGSKMNAATTQMRTTLTLARQWAITRREATHVAFPTWANDASKAYRAFIVYGEKSGYISQWSYLPDGVVIAAGAGSVFSLGQTNSLPGLTGGVRTLKFKTDGTTPSGATPINIYLAEGWVQAGVVVSRPNTWTNEFEISGLTGIAKYRTPQ